MWQHTRRPSVPGIVWATPSIIPQTFLLPLNNYSFAPPLITVNIFLPLVAPLANDDDIEKIFDDDDVNNRPCKLGSYCTDNFDKMQKIWLIMTFDKVVMKLKQSYCQTARPLTEIFISRRIYWWGLSQPEQSKPRDWLFMALFTLACSDLLRDWLKNPNPYCLMS